MAATLAQHSAHLHAPPSPKPPAEGERRAPPSPKPPAEGARRTGASDAATFINDETFQVLQTLFDLACDLSKSHEHGIGGGGGSGGRGGSGSSSGGSGSGGHVNSRRNLSGGDSGMHSAKVLA